MPRHAVLAAGSMSRNSSALFMFLCTPSHPVQNTFLSSTSTRGHRSFPCASATYPMETAASSPKPQYDFSVQVPIHRPRAWERAAKTSFAPRHRGRKVWKRYELRSKAETLNSSREDIGENDDSRERPIKRLRNAQGGAKGREGAGDRMNVGYIPTLRSEAPGTPKSMSGS